MNIICVGKKVDLLHEGKKIVSFYRKIQKGKIEEFNLELGAAVAVPGAKVLFFPDIFSDSVQPGEHTTLHANLLFGLL